MLHLNKHKFLISYGIFDDRLYIHVYIEGLFKNFGISGFY